ncbi:MAG: cytochrome c oxidase accessory protein CcoG [Rhodothermaceae bacterium]|nr:MAG: cytochrome c oxidase accessory protein CcoG [Rhodothermaceae bacterium]
MPNPPHSYIPRQNVGVLEAPEEVLTTLTREGKRKWLYPVPSEGRFTRWRRRVAWVLILLYLALPLIPINGRPAVLLDFVHREFALFGIIFYPTDTVLLMLTLILVILVVVLGTALLGRVWCGWACPQTVYMEFVFRPIERLIEGKEHVRKRRDEGPWTWDKIWRKTLKLGVFLLISLVLAHTFVAYFVGWDNLLMWMTEPPTRHWMFFVMMALTTGLVLFDFGYFREQMCTITCPYARMQSVLLDPDSLIVSYDPNRGEPRGKGKKREGLGDCIDCFACVRTCPTGIDIRDGLQMECIACTQCIDACDAIMDRIGKPRGLIRYTSENALAGKPTRIFRPRVVLYTALLAVVASLFVLTLVNRAPYDLDVGRSVGEPYTLLPDGRVANRLRFRVRNQTNAPASFRVEVVQPPDAELRPVGTMPVTLAPGEMKRLETWVTVAQTDFTGGTAEGVFRLVFSDGTTEEVTFPLLGPSQ